MSLMAFIAEHWLSGFLVLVAVLAVWLVLRNRNRLIRGKGN